MITRNQLQPYLQHLLDCDNFKDYAPNGLQVEGRENIQHIASAVTASAEVIKEAAKSNIDTLIVHHGYFWKGESPVISRMKRQRIALLIENNINLFAYHLPLDCHPLLGNNAMLGKELNAIEIEKHTAGNTPDLLWTGSLTAETSAGAFKKQLESTLKQPPLHISADKAVIQRVAWCSGAAQDFIEQAAELGVDAYISGEISERTYYQAREMNIHYFSCGHHATERLGIQALGEHLQTEFQLQHQYIDTDNPV